MSVAMLVGSGLMIRSVIMLDRMQLPYPTEEVFTARVALLDDAFPDGAARQRLWDDIEQRVAALPGVRSAGLSNQLPGLGTGSLRTHVEGTTYATSEDIPRARIAVVSPGFFATYGVEAVQGRLLNALDTRDAPRVAVVNESFVRARFPDGVALGRRVRTGPLETEEEWREIVGVVPDLGLVAVSDNVPQSQQAGLYVPLAQGDERFISISAVVDGAPLALTGPVRAAVTAADPDTPIYFVDTLRARIDQDLWFYGVFGGLFAVFGGAALFMASVGLYGVMSFSVSRRTQEMGIRMALGAEGGQVRALVLRQGMLQIAFGLVIGTGLAVLVARGLQYVVYQAKAFDPATYAVVFAALALTGLAASAIPAARATRVHPSQALRYE
jgi:predicted permease